jgi:acetyl-CoA acetyltransferase
MGEACTHNSIVYSDNITHSPVKDSASRAFAMAGVQPADMDLLSLYDCYPITVIITIEDAGFCPKGDGGPWVESRDLSYRGPLPLNTHGGQLSFGQPSYAGGMSHLTEAVRQLRGQAGKRQIKNPRLAFVNGNGGVMSTQSSLILGRDR